MLMEVVSFLMAATGLIAFLAACAWSWQTLKEEIGNVLSLSIIAGTFAFYNLVIKIQNGDAEFHNYVIGAIALAVIALDAWNVREQYGNKAALARALSSLYGVLALMAYALLFFDSGKKHDGKK